MSRDIEHIVTEYVRPVYSFVYRLVGNVSDAEDIAQEVFIKVWKKLPSYDTNKNIKTWIFAIARHTVIDWYRKKKHISFSALDTLEQTFEEQIPDTTDTGEEIFEKRELSDAIEKAFTELSIEQKTIVTLHNSEGLTFEEVADILKKPMNTVKSQYRRALAAIQKKIT